VQRTTKQAENTGYGENFSPNGPKMKKNKGLAGWPVTLRHVAAQR
jgi:hypothetical protein